MICRLDGISAKKSEEFLFSKGIKCGGAVYRSPCHEQPVFKDIVKCDEVLKNTNKFCYEHFCPPLHSGLTKEQIEKIINTLNLLPNYLNS